LIIIPRCRAAENKTDVTHVPEADCAMSHKLDSKIKESRMPLSKKGQGGFAQTGSGCQIKKELLWPSFYR